MFERLRRAMESALQALEARTGDPGEDLDRLLAGMREELIAAKAGIPEIEKQIAGFERAGQVERRKLEECVRRVEQARAIDDAETVEVALRFAEGHRARVLVAEQKLEAARAELAAERLSVERMLEQLKEATARRDALAIRARRAREGAGASQDSSLLNEFDRFAERIERHDEVQAARRELDADEELGGVGGSSGGAEAETSGADASRTDDSRMDASLTDAPHTLDREALAELQLAELKRRMVAEKEEKGG